VGYGGEARVQEGAKGHAGKRGVPKTIAIDGPAGAGKSTIGRLLADRLGYKFLDTGAMYRAVALAALRAGISLEDGDSLASLAEELPVRIERPKRGETDGRAYSVFIGEEDVTWLLRKSEVEAIVSDVAAWPDVRAALVRQQRRMARRDPIVMVGRDITTEVLPDADLKIFLDASLEQRALRRYLELSQKGIETTLDQVAEDLAERDRKDTEREAGALRQAEDAIPLNTDDLDIEETVAAACQLVERES
jgi:CMP/dCMP kinase